MAEPVVLSTKSTLECAPLLQKGQSSAMRQGHGLTYPDTLHPSHNPLPRVRVPPVPAHPVQGRPGLSLSLLEPSDKGRDLPSTAERGNPGWAQTGEPAAAREGTGSAPPAPTSSGSSGGCRRRTEVKLLCCFSFFFFCENSNK